MSIGKKSLAQRLYTGDLAYDFVGNAKKWYTFSGILLAVCILSLAIFKLTLGIQFTGGVNFEVPIKVTSSTVEDIRKTVLDLDLPSKNEISVQTLGNNKVRVETSALNTSELVKVRTALGEKAKVAEKDVAYKLTGGSFGKQITEKGAQALVVFLVLVMLLIWVYFRDWKMSIAAIIALAHDLIVTVGVYSLVGFVVTPATLIAVLTILGYSLYDTVVVFDKIKENIHGLFDRNETYSDAVNRAVNQVLIRSLNTTIIGILPVLALLIAGTFILHSGDLQDLGLALFIGMLAGAYSSICIASILLAHFKEREPEQVKHRKLLAQRAARLKKKNAAEIVSSAITVETSLTSTRVPRKTGSRAERRKRK